ncbi:hypothetical protein IGI04_024116 [Brassica rapa subsp. trilocularis]|uniref:Uncharacterized protein n=1 Tax=Brassica rapa subsp. trilocularis TaxID=1813537 RepID=A0ABQ7M7W7_BRACM|nr:hypothetical protein IGI04_024116 [Brassica rapa subsp. trilocularis]
MVVTIFEILKNIGLTTKKKMKNEAKGTIFFLSLSFSIILLRVATESHASFSCYVCCLHSQYVCYGSTTSTPLFAREIMTIFSCSNVLDRAALHGSGFEYCWLLSYEQEVRLELSGVPKNIGDHISQLFPSGREALILFFQSKHLIDKSLKPYQRVKIETLRCRFVFLNTTKVLNILLQHGYKIWKEMYGEDLDDSNVALYSEWK